MNFAQQRQPGGNTAGLALVVAFHVILGYALINGLGRKVVDVLKKPLDVAIIEEIKTPPPPPPAAKVVPQLPRVVAPPPPFVPPPEVQVEAPPVQNVIATSSKPDPAPPPIVAAPPVPVPAAPPAVSVGLACPNHMEVRSRLPYPAQAQQMGLSGEVVLEFTVTAGGQINNVTVAKSTNRLFNSAATSAVNQLRCNGQGHDVRVRVPFVFRMES